MNWKLLDTPDGRKSWVEYDQNLEIRIRTIGGNRYSVALLEYDWPDLNDIYVEVFESFERAKSKVKWLMKNAESLLETDVEEELI